MFIKNDGDKACIHEWKFVVAKNAQHCSKCDALELYYTN